MASKDEPAPEATNPAKVDPILRNALRFTVSAKEYKLLHQYLINRSPPAVQKRAPQPRRYESIVHSKNDYNAAAVRASLRVFLATQTGLKLWDVISTKLLSKGKPRQIKSKAPLWQSPNLRLSLSLSLILLFHRLLHRFFTRLRANLLGQNAQPFRRRNPRVSRILVSKLSPAVGASLAGFFLGVYPGNQLRITIAIYIMTRALEFLYNALEGDGWFTDRPWWFGSWMLAPPVMGQLLHAFVFDRDCCPKAFSDFNMKYTANYIQRRPEDYPTDLSWPGIYEVVDALGKISQLQWPLFVSPILFPAAKTLPASLSAIAPITDPAHPALKPLSCALLHPDDPSCLRTYITYYIRTFPSIAKLFTLLLTALSLPRYKTFMKNPLASTDKLVKSILRLSLFITGALGTSWGSICLFQQIFSRSFLPTQRWFLGGFLGGIWAFLERKNGRGNFLYGARASIDSLWKVGVKRGWWSGVRNGDVWLFVAGLMLVNVVFEVDAKAVSGGLLRKGLGSLRGEGFVDRAVTQERKLDKETGEKEHAYEDTK
ncbi:MAG: hypothetical protein M1812_006137 [Candelaria pacifica]|nr:MAG: hypothetical protein M1812_006137 [Candelaria pacifica]